MILPINSLLITEQHWSRFLWHALACLIGLIGLGVQVAGILVEDRQYVDITSSGITIPGAIEFLRHGVLDSLIIYLSPVGQLVQFNTYGVVMMISAFLLFVLLLYTVRSKNHSNPGSLKRDAAILAFVLIVQFASFITWVVSPYRQVKVAKANSNFVAGNLFLDDHMKCYASWMYFLALDGATDYENKAATQIDQLLPRAQGSPKSVEALMDQLEQSGNVAIEVDHETALSEEGSLKITVQGARNGVATTVSSPIPLLPNSKYEMSGWVRTEAILGEGFASVILYEDAGNWTNGRDTAIKTTRHGSLGWQPFWNGDALPDKTRCQSESGKTSGRCGLMFKSRKTPDNPRSRHRRVGKVWL
jgi:hypothetical protein